MHVYESKNDHKLYTLEHLIYDLRFTNNNGHSGIYARPYKWNGKVIEYTKENCEKNKEQFDPLKYVEDNFTKLYEINYL